MTKKKANCNPFCRWETGSDALTNSWHRQEETRRELSVPLATRLVGAVWAPAKVETAAEETRLSS